MVIGSSANRVTLRRDEGLSLAHSHAPHSTVHAPETTEGSEKITHGRIPTLDGLSSRGNSNRYHLALSPCLDLEPDRPRLGVMIFFASCYLIERQAIRRGKKFSTPGGALPQTA